MGSHVVLPWTYTSSIITQNLHHWSHDLFQRQHYQTDRQWKHSCEFADADHRYYCLEKHRWTDRQWWHVHDSLSLSLSHRFVLSRCEHGVRAHGALFQVRRIVLFSCAPSQQPSSIQMSRRAWNHRHQQSRRTKQDFEGMQARAGKSQTFWEKTNNPEDLYRRIRHWAWLSSGVLDIIHCICRGTDLPITLYASSW